MPRLARDAAPDTAEQIKTVARRQMGESGTAGLSLRAIARELGVTAPALYNYYPRLEDLITALIVDAFNALADHMAAAADGVSARRVAPKVWAMVLAYREWALDHPVDFQLIYGNPIPGYHAPQEITGPLAWRPFQRLFALFAEAYQSGELTIPAEYKAVPPTIAEHLRGWKLNTGFEMPDSLVCLLIGGWARMHGAVLLELFHHSQPPIGDTAAFYRYELAAMLRRLGMRPPD